MTAYSPVPTAPPPLPQSRAKLHMTQLGGVLALVAVVAFLVALPLGLAWLARIVVAGVGIFVFDYVWSRRALRPDRVAVSAACPPDVAVGQVSTLALTVRGPSAPMVVGVPSLRVWTSVRRADSGAVQVIHPARGVFTHLRVTVLHTAPFGLVGARRELTTQLQQPVHVVPAPEPAQSFQLPRAAVHDDQARARKTQTPELIRGARVYEPGDPLSRVHWPATARAGRIMVREFDEQTSARVVIVADLGPMPGIYAEAAARRAVWVATTAMVAGLSVTLATVEVRGTVVAPVAVPLDVGRRLALAVVGVPGLRVETEQGRLITRMGTGATVGSGGVGRVAVPVIWVTATEVRV